MTDVARAAGVSTATVSYVLSGKRPVAPATRAAVENAITELGFTVNTAARSLRTGQSTLAALIVPDIANPFFAQLAATLQEELRGLGLHVIVCNTRADRHEERALLAEAVQQRFAGVVITPFRLLPRDIETLDRADIPTVISADISFGPVDLVTPDARAATRRALERVIAAGRRRIAMIAGPRDATGGDPRLELLRDLARRLGTSAAVTGCGGDSGSGGAADEPCAPSSDPVTLEYWSWVPGMEEVVDLWNSRNPDVRVESRTSWPPISRASPRPCTNRGTTTRSSPGSAPPGATARSATTPRPPRANGPWPPCRSGRPGGNERATGAARPPRCSPGTNTRPRRPNSRCG
ncbi:LacI family DNA-binding transcriptional regulator [Streptomyces alkaliphilus]|uniref:LacI family DNA-binding transcriptional regulator n=1 Tax=Streptomyces alkaliphilus TaxID=1472722 RepID=A0A7W3T9L1_9ACTN|nr:LacI family DNA-binding transcriptional regulator [Streptomyces alkaliphilus]